MFYTEKFASGKIFQSRVNLKGKWQTKKKHWQKKRKRKALMFLIENVLMRKVLKQQTSKEH